MWHKPNEMDDDEIERWIQSYDDEIDEWQAEEDFYSGDQGYQDMLNERDLLIDEQQRRLGFNVD